MPEFYIDFGSWHIEAKDKEEARAKAIKMLEDGENPPIDVVGEV